MLVNDFGAINIDEKLIDGVDDSTISLANGCVCCEIDDDLIGAIEALIGRDESPDDIILEASGIADPFGIAMTVGNRRFEDTIRLDGIISVVDLEQIFANPEYPALQDLKLRQIGNSDMVVLNKVDLVDDDRWRAFTSGSMNGSRGSGPTRRRTQTFLSKSSSASAGSPPAHVDTRPGTMVIVTMASRAGAMEAMPRSRSRRCATRSSDFQARSSAARESSTPPRTRLRSSSSRSADARPSRRRPPTDLRTA